MKLHTVFITYNRLDLTKRAVASYLETVSVPFTLAIVDNGSRDGSREWLAGFAVEHPEHQTLQLRKNKYPGFACNRGWELAPADATHFHRADNDWEFLPGWCERVQAAFRGRRVGQVGLRTNKEEVSPSGLPVEWNVGGNNVIRRELWDAGLRYDERPWTILPPGLSEDTFMSPAVRALGYKWMRVGLPCIRGISVESIDDPYYRKSWADRKIAVNPLIGERRKRRR
jgi:glycosyltransferase involved in cell wall biosynthesis